MSASVYHKSQEAMELNLLLPKENKAVRQDIKTITNRIFEAIGFSVVFATAVTAGIGLSVVLAPANPFLIFLFLSVVFVGFGLSGGAFAIADKMKQFHLHRFQKGLDKIDKLMKDNPKAFQKLESPVISDITPRIYSSSEAKSIADAIHKKVINNVSLNAMERAFYFMFYGLDDIDENKKAIMRIQGTVEYFLILTFDPKEHPLPKTTAELECLSTLGHKEFIAISMNELTTNPKTITVHDAAMEIVYSGVVDHPESNWDDEALELFDPEKVEDESEYWKGLQEKQKETDKELTIFLLD